MGKPKGYQPIGETGLETAASSTGVSSAFFASTIVTISLAIIIATVALIIGTYAYSLAKSANDVTTVQTTVTVWVDAGAAGNDNNQGLTRSRPVKTVQRAVDILEKYSAETGIIELDGTTTHDLGTDPTLDFFPLIARYGTIVVRGRRSSSHTGTVNTTSLVDEAGSEQFIRVHSTNETEEVFSTHVIQNLNTSRFFAVETNDAGTIDIVGGNYGTQDFAIIWHDGDAFEMFQVSTVVTWSGQWNNMASFSRVIMEAIHFLPLSNTSQLITPKYRDDAMVFRACHFTVANTATYSFAEPSEAGFASEYDPRPFFRGSLQLEGCFLNGIATQTEVAPASTFTTNQADTKVVLLSVYSNGTQISFSGIGVVIGYYGINQPTIPLLASTGTFYAQGIKFRGDVLHTTATLLRVGTSTSAKIRNVDINVAGTGVVGLFMDAHSFGEISHARVICPGIFHAIRLGEVTHYRVYNVTTVAPVAISMQRLAKLDLYSTLNMTGVGTGTPLIYTESQCEINFGSIQSFANHTGRGAPIVSIANSNIDMAYPTVSWYTDLGFPLVLVADKSELRMRSDIFNLDPANVNGTVKCGANDIGLMTTQTDYASNVTQLCLCKAV